MWIAKPISQLTSQEHLAWEQIQHRPLAQTLAWARAIASVGAEPCLVFSPNERVGGIVFEAPSESLPKHPTGKTFECINGPILDWDHGSSAARQFATFALATSKLAPSFHSLVIQPRWTSENADQRLSHLPFEPLGHCYAATTIVDLLDSPERQLRSITPRLKRTLEISRKNGVTSRWDKLSPLMLDTFVPALSTFSRENGFSAPPMEWFRALTQEPEITTTWTPKFWIGTSKFGVGSTLLSVTQILIVTLGTEAHYLFGYEKRSPGLRSAISTSAIAHWEAMSQCIKMGIETYDLNGYTLTSDAEDPYYGVSQFKKQFSGKIVCYVVPKFRIQ